MLTVVYQRFRRMVSLRIGAGESMAHRLVSADNEFTPLVARLSYHPLICIEYLTVDTVGLQGGLGYPGCYPDAYEFMTANVMTIHTGDTLNMTKALPDFASCGMTVVSRLLHGTVTGGDGVLYKHNARISSGKEVVLFYIVCGDDNSKYVLSTEIETRITDLTANVKNLVVTDRITALNSYNLNVSRPKIGYSMSRPIRFVLKSRTTHGFLKFKDKVLRYNDSFSQTDVDHGFLVYNILGGASAFEEAVEMLAISLGTPPLPIQVTILYNPTIEVKLRTLRVTEGRNAMITTEIIDARYGVSNALSFVILEQPFHGMITQATSGLPLDSFFGQDVVSRSLVYVHDSSESTFDSVTLLVVPTENDGVEKTVVLNISIALRNDNIPARNSSVIITVVNGKDTFLDSTAISYVDADSDQLYGDITIERQAISCGEIVRSSMSTPVYTFSQSDLSSGQLIFRHVGGYALCNLPLLVSDGYHALSEVVEIFPTDYKLEINGTLSMNVSRHAETTLNDKVLSIRSNTKVPPSQIVIIVKRFPLHGIFPLFTSGRFTYQDIRDGRVTYKHQGTLSVSDTFTVKIRVDEMVHTRVINVVIDTDPNLLKPFVTRNYPVAGTPGTMIPLNYRILSVHHPLATPAELKYQVPSQRAREFVLTSSNGSLLSSGVFTQEDVNAGQLVFSLTRSSAPSTVLVSFRGVSTDLIFTPIVLNDYIDALVTDSLNVAEGGISILHSPFITPVNSSLENELLSIVVTQSPLHTRIYRNYTFETKLFTLADLAAGLISLRHDGSETTNDSMRVKLRYPVAESEEKEAMIIVVPFNDHAPTFNASGDLQPPTIWIGKRIHFLFAYL